MDNNFDNLDTEECLDDIDEYDNLDSKDIYIAKGYVNNILMLYVTPKTYFDENGYQYDSYWDGSARKIIDDAGFYEIMENVFELDMTKNGFDKAYKCLIKSGFKEHPEFSELIREVNSEESEDENDDIEFINIDEIDDIADDSTIN